MAARILNLQGVYSQGLQVVEFDIDDRGSGEKDTGFDFAPGDIIFDVWAKIATPEATGTTKTLDVGLASGESGGDADGLADGLSTVAAGVVLAQAVATEGDMTLYFSSTTRGALLQDFEAGSDVDQDEGLAHDKKHVVTTAKSLTYTLGSAATEIVGKGYVLFWRAPA